MLNDILILGTACVHASSIHSTLCAIVHTLPYCGILQTLLWPVVLGLFYYLCNNIIYIFMHALKHWAYHARISEYGCVYGSNYAHQIDQFGVIHYLYIYFFTWPWEFWFLLMLSMLLLLMMCLLVFSSSIPIADPVPHCVCVAAQAKFCKHQLFIYLSRIFKEFGERPE